MVRASVLCTVCAHPGWTSQRPTARSRHRQTGVPTHVPPARPHGNPRRRAGVWKTPIGADRWGPRDWFPRGGPANQGPGAEAPGRREGAPLFPANAAGRHSREPCLWSDPAFGRGKLRLQTPAQAAAAPPTAVGRRGAPPTPTSAGLRASPCLRGGFCLCQTTSLLPLPFG